MSVVYITGDVTDEIPHTLIENTIYLLNEGSHVVSDTLILKNCSAIVGSGDASFYTTLAENSYGSIYYTDNTNNSIIDNVKFDGESDGN